MRLKIGDKTYRLREPSELTLSDWAHFNSDPWPADEAAALDHVVGILSRLTTAPKGQLKRVRVGDLERAVTLVTDSVAAAVKAQQADPPASFTFGGVTYQVPSDLEDVDFERWHTFTAILRGVDKEVDAYAFSLACLAIGPNEFDASTVGERAEAFKAMPMMQALTVCAFFFGSSERYRSAMTGWSRSLVTSVMQQIAPMLKPHATA